MEDYKKKFIDFPMALFKTSLKMSLMLDFTWFGQNS